MINHATQCFHLKAINPYGCLLKRFILGKFIFSLVISMWIPYPITKLNFISFLITLISAFFVINLKLQLTDVNAMDLFCFSLFQGVKFKTFHPSFYSMTLYLFKSTCEYSHGISLRNLSYCTIHIVYHVIFTTPIDMSDCFVSSFLHIVPYRVMYSLSYDIRW